MLEVCFLGVGKGIYGEFISEVVYSCWSAQGRHCKGMVGGMCSWRFAGVEGLSECKIV